MIDIVGSIARVRGAALVATLAAATALVACDTGDGRNTVTPAPDGGDGVLFEPPAPILAARAIVQENLFLQVLVDGVPQENATRQEDGRLWSATLSLAPGRTYEITLTWFERLSSADDPDGLLGPEGLLPLAVATREFSVSARRRNELRILSTDYDATGFDADNDRIPNLDERRAETRPVDDESPGTPVVDVPLTATFQLPAGLADADPESVLAFDVRASVGGRSLPVTRDGTSWTGTLDVVQDTGPVVVVAFFADSGASLVLADAQRSVEATGDAPSVTFGPGDYELRDSDADGFSNFDELVGGTRPFDASDPPADPCDVSNFEPGCATDTDGDGRTDSQEGESADRDGDGTPDYRESSQVDSDDDGVAADLDVDEEDACVPSTANATCQALRDGDGDRVDDDDDNCPTVSNSDQSDVDGDGRGDACDDEDGRDPDGDGVLGDDDNCPAVSNGNQSDVDGDGRGDACDDADARDPDGDGVLDDDDNCPAVPNRDQSDVDRDGVGDACDDADGRDPDGDGVLGDDDNCPAVFNAGQNDVDRDGVGDACDDEDGRDPDGDGVLDPDDNCPTDANRRQNDRDEDGIGDACDDTDDTDTDGDRVIDDEDNCPAVPNRRQDDLDEDGIGDVCDTDRDGDGVANGRDNCPLVFNENQGDVDEDGIGDQCDPEDDRDPDGDGDGMPDGMNTCPTTPDVDQVDTDGDGDAEGGACDEEVVPGGGDDGGDDGGGGGDDDGGDGDGGRDGLGGPGDGGMAGVDGTSGADTAPGGLDGEVDGADELSTRFA